MTGAVAAVESRDERLQICGSAYLAGW